MYAFFAERKKGSKHMFTPKEDAQLLSLVAKYGTGQWKMIAAMLPTRTTRQCRERYRHYLDPTLNNDPWTKEEEDLLFEKYAEVGPKWAYISTFFPNRTDVNVKNHHATVTQRMKSKMNTKLQAENSLQSPKTPVSSDEEEVSVPKYDVEDWNKALWNFEIDFEEMDQLQCVDSPGFEKYSYFAGNVW